MRIFSFGGGVQSMAALVLTAQKKLNYDYFIFANVGEDSENPKTLEYFNKVALPYASSHNIPLLEVKKSLRDGSNDTLMNMVQRSKRSIPIPVRMANGAPGNRTCTSEFKIKVVAKWAKTKGATKNNKAIVGIGISVDEISRMNTNSGIAWIEKEHPLIEERLSRIDCRFIINDAGLLQPPKSACFFCPFKKLSEWQYQRKFEPELFEASCRLETFINGRREGLGKDRVWLTRFNKPLAEAVDVSQQSLQFEDLDNCESGYCMT